MKNSNIKKIAEKLQLRTNNIDGQLYFKEPNTGHSLSENSFYILQLMQCALITSGFNLELTQNTTKAYGDRFVEMVNLRYNNSGMATLFLELLCK